MMVFAADFSIDDINDCSAFEPRRRVGSVVGSIRQTVVRSDRSLPGEVSRVTSRLRLASVLALIALAGCGPSGPIRYAHNQVLDGEEFAAKPQLRAKVIAETERLFGASPSHLKIPRGAGLPEGGRYLGNLTLEGAGADNDDDDEQGGVLSQVVYLGEQGQEVPIAGGQALYRRYCLHCHGVTGDGEGPTAPFLYPRPRDYRPGMFKFTSTDYGMKPTRDDLRRTILYGLHGTSMPAFEAQISRPEIEQVIDYVIFLSMRGEVERGLMEEAAFLDDSEAEYLEELAPDVAQTVFRRWQDAQRPEAIAPTHGPRVASTPESVDRGRQLFLGLTQGVKLECAGCHGAQGRGNGPSWVEPDIFNEFVFRGDPSPERILALKDDAEARQKRWGDDWGDPLRPADLNRGVYKGGRRPIDLYWRIATGITGTPMPSHTQALNADPDDIWHLVNFILALPYERELLQGAESPITEAAVVAPVASQPAEIESEPKTSGRSMTALP